MTIRVETEDKSSMSDFPERITCVEDDEAMRVLIRESIEKKRKDTMVMMHVEGQEFINLVKDIPPDLILLDMVMPGLNGPATLHRLAKIPQVKSIPIIIITGKTKLVMNEEYRALSVIGIIHKPFNPDTLADDIGALWCEHKGT